MDLDGFGRILTDVGRNLNGFWTGLTRILTDFAKKNFGEIYVWCLEVLLSSYIAERIWMTLNGFGRFWARWPVAGELIILFQGPLMAY